MTTDLQPFSEWITDHARGTVDQEMTAALAQLTQTVSQLGKKGTVALKVTVEPAGSGGRTVATACVVDIKEPQPDAEKSIFYVDENGGLHRDDPFQGSLAPAKKIDSATGEIRTLTNEE